MRIMYKGGAAKSPAFGRLIRGRTYEVSNEMGSKLLTNTDNWKVMEMVERNKPKRVSREYKKVEDKKEDIVEVKETKSEDKKEARI